MNKTPDEIKKGLECLDKMQFFMGQRAGRELWMEKPKDVQEKDIESYNRDIKIVRNLIQQIEAANTELLEKVEQLEKRCLQLERERDAAVKALVLVDEKVEQAQEALDNGVFYRVDYSTYLSLRNMVDDILSWHYEDDQRGVKED